MAKIALRRPDHSSIYLIARIGILVLFALILGNGYMRYRATEKLLGASGWVEHTMAVNTQLQLVGSLLKDAETGQRGYLLTGQDSYLDPYRKANQELAGALQRLGELTRDNPAQSERVERLKELSARKLAELRQTIELYQEGHAESAKAIVQSNAGRNDMEVILSTLTEMERRERALLAERKSSLRSEVFRAHASLVIGLLAGMVAVLGFGWALNRAESERVSSTAAILESEEWLSTTLGSIGDAVIATDANGNVRFLNRVAQGLTLVSQKDAEGRHLREIFPIVNEVTREPAESPVEKAIRTGKVVGLANHTVLVRADGTEIAIDDSAAPILNRDGKTIGVVLVFRDVTEQREAEKAMRISEKLAATGKLAATVAHEINNPLEAAANLLYLMRDDSGLTTEGLQYLKLAEEQLSRVAHITKQTLAFYRDPRQPEPLELSAVCDRILDLYRSRFKNKSLQLIKNYQQNLVVFGTEGELAQVVSNLVGNAVDAAEQNGRISVTVARGDDHQGTITVSDDGCGIDPKNLPRVFEPFFTTKKDVGTGLGLWVSREIVEKLGGKIDASSPGQKQGATFSIALPLYDAGSQQTESAALSKGQSSDAG